MALLSVSANNDNPLDGSAMGGAANKQTPVFVTEQTLVGFTAMTAVVQLVWKVLQAAVSETWVDSAWTAAVIAGLIGIAQFLPVVRGNKVEIVFRALIFALLNTALLWAAALGLDEQLPQ
jgi:steroid 5-alpha reductase family enzyme